MDMDSSTPFSEPVASTSRAVFHLPYKPPTEPVVDDPFSPDELWFRLYEHAWAATSSRIHATLSSLHDASLDEIVSFVDQSRDAGSTLLAALAGRASLRTGLIVGANPTSSPLLFSALIRQITAPPPASTTSPAAEEPMDLDDRTPPPEMPAPKAPSGSSSARHPCIVSRLTSRECGNIKNAMRSLIAGFIGNAPEMLDDDEDEDGPAIVTSKLKSATLVPEDMQNLTAWFAHRYRQEGAEKEEPTLVVLLEDLEGMDGKVLGLMLETLSRYVSKLPIVFLLGVATSADALNQVLWRGVTNLLETATFFVEPGIATFNALMRGLFIDWEAPLALGPKAFAYLLNTFEDTHHSIDATISALQSLYMTHIRSRNQGLVLYPVSMDVLEQLPDKIFSTLLKLPSLQAANPEGENAEVVAMLKANDGEDEGEDFMRGIEECRRLRSAWQNDRRVGVEVFETMMEYWEKRWSTEKVLLALEEGKLSSFSDELCGMVLQSTSAKLPRFLALLITRLTALLDLDPSLSLEPTLAPESTSSEALSEAGTPFPEKASPASTLHEFLTTSHEELVTLLAKPKPSGRNNLVNENVPGAELMHAASSLTEGDREFTRLAKEVSETLKSHLRRAFRPSSSLLLHEVWFSDDIHPFKRFHPAFLPSFQRTFRSADASYATGPAADAAPVPTAENDNAEVAPPPSSSPEKGKSKKSKGKGKEKELAEGGILGGGPSLDVAVAYRLYKETGKTINLGDWWNAFDTAAWDEEQAEAEGAPNGLGKKRRRGGSEEGTEDGDSEEDDEEEDAQVRKQARFLRALGDLGYVGFIQPTSRKPEHVLKSVF
ncbi:origin recognition complex subunit 3 N-terminus-domain-containing protein [Leucosporidium creatinivorum]|uniref:Origin recognition complex subunit 3 N-terminus-domain-containing protein n=1 Tax=Leucosporidium creatinivorum TaxID=106004 RepID=A0A1Y2DJM0_9BASI|nr:origin recognition complex subunit 3 N-terminus-domain-containing protein [Leucosporidium creatinivorum]